MPTTSPYKTGGRYAYQANFLKNYALKHNHLIATLPTGSGKSMLMMTYIAHRAKQRKTTVVLVPKLGIATGFEKYINNGPFSINVEDVGVFSLPSLTGRAVNPTSNKKEEVKTLIETRQPMIICSYQAIIGAWDKLSKEAKQNVAFLLDEGHHSGMCLSEKDTGGTEIGKIIDMACKENIPVHIYTATDFRADGRSLVPGHTDFVTFRRTMKRHFDEGCCPDFCMYFRFYDKVKIKQYEELDNNGGVGDDVKIGNIQKLIYSYVDEYTEHKQPTLMIIPQKIRGFDIKKFGNSAGVAFVLDKELRKRFPGIRILNLGSVDGKTYEASKHDIREKYEKLATDKFDVVISIRVADEGIDWPDCSQVFFPRVPGSLGLIVQRIGRAMRGREGKDFSRIVFFELGVLQKEGKDFELCGAMFKLAVRMKALYYGLDWTEEPTEWCQEKKDKCSTEISVNPHIDNMIDQAIGKVVHDLTQTELLDYCVGQFYNYGIEIDGVSASKWLIKKGYFDFTNYGLKNATRRLEELSASCVKLGDEKLNELLEKAEVVGVGEFLRLFDDRGGSIRDFDRIISEFHENSADENKKILLEMARRGEPRPNSKTTTIGKALSMFLVINRPGYDKNFDDQIREEGSHWFVTNENKQKLLKMAKNGEKRPHSRTYIGRALNRYICESACFDNDFYNQIKELAPKWFEKSSEKNKKILLEMARRGEQRPSKHKTKLGEYLRSYTSKIKNGYDSSFDNEIRRIAPRWFEKTSDESKKILIKMAQENKPKPSVRNSSIGRKLRSYTDLSQDRTFDEVFNKLIRKLAPHWFREKRIF